ncbi:MAG: NF038122 family metalloprotease [Blastocatellia bacterium]|nr:NF038122 family metalloprotease [Blastocatellia bacterium]
MMSSSKFAYRMIFSLGLFAALCIHQGASSTARTRADEPRGAGAAFVLRFEDGRVECREATPGEREAMGRREEALPLRALERATREEWQQAAGLKITLRSTTQLDGFPAAKNAFIKAAQRWEALIQTPITVVVDVDYGPTRFGQPYSVGTLGSTEGQLISGPGLYTAVRTALLARATSPQETTLYNALPTSSAPTDIGTTTTVSGPSPLFRALGFLNPVADPTAEQAQFGPPPSVGFNSGFTFDFDPTDGISAGALDFDSIAFHELGHVLGFSSNVGVKELIPTFEVTASIWDLFRLRPGATTATFPTAQRILSSGGNQVFYDGGIEVPLSTGRPDSSGGDGKQPSHWKDDLLFGGYLGMMIPTVSPGQRNLTTLADLRVMDVMGFGLRTTTATGSAEAKLDDGTVEGGLRAEGLMIVNRFTPASYPATLQNIRLQFRTFSGQPDPTGKPMTLVYFTDPSGSSNGPNQPQITRLNTTVPGTSATTFFDFPIQNGPTINSGDFYVGYLSPATNPGLGFPLDTNSTAFGRSFVSQSDGATFQLISPPPGTSSANATIRAVLSSTGSAPALQTSPAALDFGSVAAGASADRLLTIRNTGTAILTINGMATDSIRFGVVAVTNSFVIPPGGQETIPIRFLPVASGTQTATLSIPSNDPAKPTVNIPLNGNGTTQQANRILRVVAAGGSPGGSVVVPVELVSQGDENGLGFSLAFDQNILTNPQATLGADAVGASLNVNSSQVAQGRLGIGLVLPTGQKFAAGPRRIVNINFTIAATTTAATTNITFGDQPIAREVVDAAANTLPAGYTSAAVTITQGTEADVSPRPNGNGSVSVADWVQVGRFVAGLDLVSTGSEFQRADCAPKDTRGNGSLSVADWVQAGRYAAGLDPIVGAGGPAGPPSSAIRGQECAAGFGACPPFALSRQVREFIDPPFIGRNAAAGALSLSRSPIGRGRTESFELVLDAQGLENALGFSLRFDPRELRFVSASPGPDAAGATLHLNADAAGHLGFALALPAEQSFAQGARRLVTVRFLRLTRAAPAVRFDDWPVRREAVNARAESMPLAVLGPGSANSAK